MQNHFEFHAPVAELREHEERLIALGTEKSPHQDPNDPGLIKFLDPLVIRSASSKLVRRAVVATQLPTAGDRAHKATLRRTLVPI